GDCSRQTAPGVPALIWPGEPYVTLSPKSRLRFACPLPMVSRSASYVGRFAPSPSGPLHLGSVVAAMASWLDARAHRGHWLVRMEDVDQPRTVPGADAVILDQLCRLGFRHDGQIWW